MLRGHSRRRVKPKPSNGWVIGDDHPEPIRRRLRDATLFDRLLIALFFFITGAMATGGLYWYLSGDSGHTRRYGSSATLSQRIVTPFEQLTGEAARNHFLLVCLIGGVVAAAAYAFISLADPYGTTVAAKAEKKRKKDRFELLKEAGFPVEPSDENEDPMKQRSDSGNPEQ
jgi:hypothetical protein